MINARITFSNIQALDVPVEGVTSLSEDSGRSSVAIDDAVFAAPRSYEQLGAGAGTAEKKKGTQLPGSLGGQGALVHKMVALAAMASSLGPLGHFAPAPPPL